MGHKVHPTGFRLGVTAQWTSNWYAEGSAYRENLNKDIAVRTFLREKLAQASVSRVQIDRPAKSARVTIHTARPGIVIGKKGEDIEKLKHEVAQKIGLKPDAVHISVEEIRKPELDSQLIADSIAQQLEKRIMFRRAMKRAMQNAMRLGAQGIKIMSAGRLNGIEIARTEWYREGRVPLHTLRADIDYGMGEAKTNYGVIGIKVWVYKGEIVPKGETALLPAAPATPTPAPEAPSEPKRAKKPFPKAGAKKGDRGGPARPRADGDRKPAPRKGDAAAAAPAPKTTVKKAKKIVKEEGGGGETKE